MEIHHSKHHAGYVAKFNDAIKGVKELESKSASDLLIGHTDLPPDVRQAVINNAGGHVNHTLFWSIMGQGKGSEPNGDLGSAISSKFGSFEQFQEEFSKSATTRFGSGWAWLVVDSNGELQVTSTPNQDSPLMFGNKPILGLDVWEHAYYLKYQNRRPDYVDAWWNVVNWEEVGRLFAEARQSDVAQFAGAASR